MRTARRCLLALTRALRERCAGKRVGLIVCGANMDAEGYCRHITQALADLVAGG